MSPYRATLVIFFISLNKIICNAELAEEGIVSPVVELAQGKLKGFEKTSTDGKTFYSFMGIPFAQPPVGDLRFEDPVKSEKWTGVLEAKKQPSECLQLILFHVIHGEYVSVGKEDCLYLNVFTPKKIMKIMGQTFEQPLGSVFLVKLTDIDDSLPVMVYIHGGGYVGGSASLHPPDTLLNEEIVLVVIQYRVGVFGFLSTEDSTMPGNLGMKDQTMALKWVQENIRSFGGNPDKVTIFGESAGGGSVHYHVLSPHSKGLFVGAIAQSGTALCPWSTGYQHRKYAEAFGEKVGCSLIEDSLAFKKCVKKMDAEALVVAMGPFYKWGFTPLETVPRVDGDFLPDEPATLLKTGRYNKVNLIIGINRDEGALDTVLGFLNPKLKKALIEEFETIAPYALRIESEPDASNLSKVIVDHYLKGKTLENNPIDEVTEMFSDCAFKMCVDMTSLLHAKDSEIVLYLYELNHRGQNSIIDLFGADDSFPKTYVSHGDDMFYLFPGGPFFPVASESEDDLELTRKILKLWTNFAKFGNPTPDGSFDFLWSPSTSAYFEHLSITTQPTMKNYPRKQTLEFWMTLDIRVNRLLSPEDITYVQKLKDEL